MSNYKWLKSTETIEFSINERIARITLNRPDKRNAISDQMLDELEQALLEADDRKDVNVIILAGAGKDFCAGYDLTGSYGGGEEGSGPDYDPALYRAGQAGGIDDDCWSMERTLEKRLRMFDLHKPIIARVHGNCLAGGTDLAFLCDMVIASDESKIGFPATRANGTPPTQLWLHMVGPQWAKRMLFTGDTLSGKDAAKVGLVLESVPVEDLDAEVNELARRISFVDPDMLSAHKRAINVGLELMGARTLQRMVAELDARAHLNAGPRRQLFRKEAKELGLKAALKSRDEPFGDGKIRLSARNR